MENTEETQEPKIPEGAIECPYHPGEYYMPWEYCEQCYIEEKE